jgi:regulator of protease activity HflC (stomatin/prohibitin superfamily)
MVTIGFVLLVVAVVTGLVAWSGPGGRGAYVPRVISVAAFVLAILALVSSGFTQIGAGQVGVSSLFGAVDTAPLSQGLHLINPLKSVTQMSARTETVSVHAGPGGGQSTSESVDAISSDGMRMPLDVTVNYRLVEADAPWVYQHLGEDYAYKIVIPATRTAVREGLARFSAQEAYSTKRSELTAAMESILRQHLRSLLDDYKFTGKAVILQQVLLRNIGIPDQVRDAIEKKLSAEQQALAMQFVLQKETQEAERKRIEARGIADFQKIVTEGISDKLLAWKGIEATLDISKSPNAKVIVIGNGKNGLPLIFDSSGAGGGN